MKKRKMKVRKRTPEELAREERTTKMLEQRLDYYERKLGKWWEQPEKPAGA